jgi:hypothetical protein
MINLVNKAIYSTLTTSGLTVVDVGNWDLITYPSVVIGDNVVTQEVCKSTIYYNISATFHIFSNYNGSKEINNMMSTIINNVNSHMLITGHTITASWVENSLIQQEQDNIKHGILRISLKVL